MLLQASVDVMLQASAAGVPQKGTRWAPVFMLHEAASAEL